MFQTHSLTAISAGTMLGGDLLILLGIALAACVLGIQVACIVILAKKMIRAGKDRDRMEGQETNDSYSQFGFAGLGAAILPMSAEGILMIAVALNALAAIVLMILVASAHAKGYEFASLRSIAAAKKSANDQDRKLDERMVDHGVSEPVEQADFYETAPAYAAMETDGEATETAVVAADAGLVAVSPVVTSEVTTVVRDADGKPVRVVKIEKEYSETIRETIPGTPVAEANNEQTAQLLAKIERLLEKLEGGSESKQVHLANGIILGADEPVPMDEDADADEDDYDDDVAASDENGDEEDDADTELNDTDHFTGNERIIGFDEETGYYIMAHYRKSFEAKLIQARPNVKRYYSQLKNALLAYNGTKSRISWAADSFHNGRAPIAKINAKTKQLELYLAIDPASLEGSVYKGQDVSHLKKYADTPFRYKVRSPRKLKWALELVQRVSEEHGLSPIDIEPVDYEAIYPFEDTDSLVARDLIKEYIREEKPASTFELDETHVPSVSDLDETVIPANANVSWEFDNEVMAQKALEEEAAAVEEEIPAEEPAPAAEPVTPQPTVIRETTRVTQVRYTEQQFGASGETISYKEYFSEDGSFPENVFDPEPETAETVETAEAASEETELYDATAYDDAVYDAENGAEAASECAEELYEESYAESDAFDTEEEGDLDWSVPAGISEQDAIVIDADGADYADSENEIYGETYEEESYEEESYEEIYEESDGETYEETYEEGYESEEYAEEAYAEEGETYEEAYEEVHEDAYEEAPATKPNPEVALVDVGILDEHFQSGALIDLEALKDKGLVLPNTKTLKIYKSGEITKSFTVVADHFTMDAIFAIDGAGGNIQMIKK